MLTELIIENLGVIERAELLLGHGMTVFTGETGAGKTMLVEAVALLVGGRADPSRVRHGASEARVDGRFMLGSDREERECIISRVVSASGRSRAYVDGRPANLAQLANTLAGVVDLHGQHAHQALLDPVTQRNALDEFGEIDLKPLDAARARVAEIAAELATLGGDERERARELDLLRFQVAELDAANIVSADEDDVLSAEETVYAHAAAHREAGAHAYNEVLADGRALDSLHAALAAVDERVPYSAIAERLHACIAEVSDLGAELRTVSESIEEHPERLADIRQRRQLLVELKRKYGNDLAEVMAFHQHVAARLDELERFAERAEELETTRQAALVKLDSAARMVGEARRTVAPELAREVESHLGGLALGGAHVEIAVGQHADDVAGDAVTFLFSANPGSPMLPLARVASGGELARVMLALRLALGRTGATGGTILFDEVDAGIGGEAAVSVGEALAKLSRSHQIVVVTHLAQVAAQANHHYKIDKTSDAEHTRTSVVALDTEARTTEVARMLSGNTSDQAIAHARELLR